MGMTAPTFYDPDRVGELYLERAALVAEEAKSYGEKNDIRPAAQDEFRVAAFGIDCQIGFCLPGASLFVPGAVEDTRRTIGWIYRNIDKITGLHFSMDTHRIYQIFHPAWWVDARGRHPDPLTPISSEDVRGGKAISTSTAMRPNSTRRSTA